MAFFRNLAAPGPAVGAPTVTNSALHEDIVNADLSHIYHGLWLGGRDALQPELLSRLGIRYVVNASRELRTEDFVDWDHLRQYGIIVMHVRWEDVPHQQIFPSQSMSDAIAWMGQILHSGNQVLVNCAMGRSRSVSLVAGYLIQQERMTLDQALALIRSKRPIASPNQGFLQQLRSMERHHHSPVSAAHAPAFPSAAPANNGPWAAHFPQQPGAPRAATPAAPTAGAPAGAGTVPVHFNPFQPVHAKAGHFTPFGLVPTAPHAAFGMAPYGFRPF